MSEMVKMALRKVRRSSNNLKFAPPCVDSYGVDKLLQNKDNRKALGIPENVIEYSMCNDDDDFDYQRSKDGSYWVY